jgi:hypothetical protein
MDTCLESLIRYVYSWITDNEEDLESIIDQFDLFLESIRTSWMLGILFFKKLFTFVGIRTETCKDSFPCKKKDIHPNHDT